ncbi:helix-turn-helix transcriptional regulator [Fodinicola feengrottensis]|uniref:Helix-turn-helix transcriptional regulator n=1 Tax=Fodinicola feengrottensis TaxID=435914 RepID=A0ABN2GLU9_9ACTN
MPPGDSPPPTVTTNPPKTSPASRSNSPSSSVQHDRRQLGARLRQLRKAAGLTGRQLGEATAQDSTRVSKLENGVQEPTDQDLVTWCTACGALDQVESLRTEVRRISTAYLELKQQAKAGMKRVLGAHTNQRYATTRRFRVYEQNVIPGLFQTADYAAAMLSSWIDFLDTPNDLDEAVTIRLERQKILYDQRKRFEIVLDEHALYKRFGSISTQIGQLDRLLTVMDFPTVSLGIIPTDAARGPVPVPSIGFWIFNDTLAALETPTATLEVTKKSEIQLYARLFDGLRTNASYRSNARSLLTKAITTLTVQLGSDPF